MKALERQAFIKKCLADDNYYDDPKGETRQVVRDLLRILSPEHRAEVINVLAAEDIFCFTRRA
jgi:hypothetical protein